MTKVPLRTYLREIEDAIEEGQTEEAIAHCRHILRTFPKHTDTYRLLGKAYLETQKYSNAGDIFQRVLSAIPDDFVSHLGMSVIREDEGNIDAALWHMERAFEVQPYNPAIQGEVRRLYGKRDGMEPAKARLTRGALARMYVKGGHYDQAIAELRASLVDEPDRSDLQIILAEMHARRGENVKAIETCSTILTKLPFCFQANRLLAELLQGTERQEESKTYQQRVHALDPYEAHVSSYTSSAEDVPEQAVMVERLRWSDAMRTTASEEQPEWASSLGVELEMPDSSGGDLPDWLSSAPEDVPATPEDGDISPSQVSDDEIPEWMRDAGWEPSSEEAEQDPTPIPLDDEEGADDDTAVAADLPEWVKDMAPAATSLNDTESTDDAGDDLDAIFDDAPETSVESDVPTWLKDIEGESEPEQTPSAEASSSEASNQIPDETPESTKEASAQPDDAPHWLKEIEDVPAVEEAVHIPEDSSPDWLDEISEEDEPVAAEAQTDDDIPDWLMDVDGEPPAAAEEDISDGVTDFLLGLEGDQSTAESHPVEEDQSQVDDESPDWLGGFAEDEPAPEPSAAAEAVPDLPLSVEEEPPAAATEDQAPPPTAEEPAAQPEFEIDDIPDWLKSASDEESPSSVVEEAESQPDAEADDAPEWVKSLDEAEQRAEAEQAAAESAIPDWLDELAEVKLAEESVEEAAPAEESPVTGPPDWLAEISEEETTAGPEEDLRPTPPAWSEAVTDAPEEPDEQETPQPTFEDAEPEPQPEAEAEFPEWLTTEDASEIEPEPTQVEDPAATIPTEDATFREWQAPPGDEEPAEEPAPGLEDDDTAMAWLEGLAAKQGVSEEELITSPEDRPEAPPDWVQDIAPGPEAEISEESPPVESEAVGETVPEDIPSWLQDSAFAATEAEEPLDDIQPEETTLESGPDEDAKELEEEEALADARPPELAAESEPAAVADDSDELGDLPDWLKDTGAEQTPAKMTPETDAEIPTEEQVIDEDDALPDWLKDISGEPEDLEDATWIREFGKEVPSFEIVQEEEPAAPEDDLQADALPEWLQEVTKDKTELPDWTKDEEQEEQPDQETEYTWRPSQMETEQPVEMDAEAQEKLDLNEASLVELERLPGMGFRRAQAIFSHREEHGPFNKLDDLLVLGIGEETIEGIKDLVEVKGIPEAEEPAQPEVFEEPVAPAEPTAPPESKAPSEEEIPAEPALEPEEPTPVPSPPPISLDEAEDEYHAKQIGAQTKLSQGDVSGAIKDFEQLLKRGKRLDEIITALEAADSIKPNDPEILQTLGDAYMRADRLQEALDTYSKIEKLLL